VNDVWTYDKVHSSQLLERLEETAGGETLAEATAEAVDVGRLAERHLVLVVGGDFAKLFDERL